MMQISINQSDLDRINLLLGGLKDKAPLVMSRAINKTLAGVLTDTKTVVREKYNYKAGSIAKSATILKSRVVDGLISPGLITVGGRGAYGRGKGFPLAGLERIKQEDGASDLDIFDNPNAKYGGVKIRTRVGGKTSILPSTFIATMKSGHKGVFKRTGKKTRYGKGEIKELFTTSVPDAMSNEDSWARISVLSKPRLDKNIIHELKFVMSKL